ncbi:MAG: cytochrome c-type biogenesis protein CcmH [Ponticaulis sp.]|nr:cytochrome c-type biogenesis protein CcmH [Ponticaulis sp.]|tara:strand:+ start:22711 stop:23175 length:465 start_codon:yes stop_codon:yes gene_type:complete
MIRALLIALSLFALPALAQQGSDLSEAEVKARTESIGKTLRCVVCQNQSIADSDATLAEDMRTLVEARVRAGDSDEDVRAYFRERYGDFVLMDPPVETYTWLLWFGPLLFVLAGLSWYLLSIRKPSESVAEDESDLSDAERERLKKLLGDDPTA